MTANHLPESYFRPSYLLEVPYLREAGRFMNRHGVTPDASIVHGYVTGKTVENGEHLVELACWAKDIDGNIHTECAAMVVLPSRG